MDLKRCRERMVREQIEARGVKNPLVLAAMRSVQRHLFVPEALQSQAYEDHPLPIGHGQTISQPYIVAWMSELLEIESGMKVLEIGTGSGYQAAVLAEMGAEVYSVERIAPLLAQTRTLLTRLRYFKVKTKLDDGTLGWPDEAPYDRIIVTAGGREIPEPLLGQLNDPGHLIIPVGKAKRCQSLLKVSKADGKIETANHGDVLFVDLIGKHGW